MTPKQQFDFKAPSHKATTGAAPAIVTPSPLIGVWTNTDAATNDIVKVIIEAAGAGISVQVFGACVPTPCVWGSVPGIAYAANVSSSPGRRLHRLLQIQFCAGDRHRPPRGEVSQSQNVHGIHRW